MGDEQAYSGSIVRDRICLELNDNCVDDVTFFAVGNDWKYYNMLGLAPKKETVGPYLIRDMVRAGIITE